MNKMREEDTELYTSISAYLNAPDGMRNEVDMWAVAGGMLIQECVKKETGSVYGGLHDKIGHSIRNKIKEISVLDVCCGPGNFANYLSLYHPKMKVTGVDINEKFISYAQRVFSKYGWKFLREDVLQLNLDQRFDFVTASSAYHHIPDKDKIGFFKKVKEHLIEEGELIMCDHFLPTYESEDERKRSVNKYYDALIKFYKNGNATKEAISLILEVQQLEISRESEQKVDFKRFESHLEAAGLKIEDRKIIWQPLDFRLYDAGSQVILICQK